MVHQMTVRRFESVVDHTLLCKKIGQASVYGLGTNAESDIDNVYTNFDR